MSALDFRKLSTYGFYIRWEPYSDVYFLWSPDDSIPRKNQWAQISIPMEINGKTVLVPNWLEVTDQGVFIHGRPVEEYL